MSQEALADKADVSRAYVGKLENAKFSATIDLLQRMAAALDVDISRLFAERI
jgi:transcriptional regulator with XRE-family HTH domain